MGVTSKALHKKAEKDGVKFFLYIKMKPKSCRNTIVKMTTQTPIASLLEC